MNTTQTLQWLPTSVREVKERGWDVPDVILFSGDAYVDHPSFGGAVVGRLLESLGLKVALVPQPNWQDDLRDFKKLGKPNLFFGISPVCSSVSVPEVWIRWSTIILLPDAGGRTMPIPRMDGQVHVPICLRSFIPVS